MRMFSGECITTWKESGCASSMMNFEFCRDRPHSMELPTLVLMYSWYRKSGESRKPLKNVDWLANFSFANFLESQIDNSVHTCVYSNLFARTKIAWLQNAPYAYCCMIKESFKDRRWAWEKKCKGGEERYKRCRERERDVSASTPSSVCMITVPFFFSS